MPVCCAGSHCSVTKNELVRHRQVQNQTEARQAIVEHIKECYNCRRLHQALGYRSPEEFEKMAGVPLNPGIRYFRATST